MKKENLKKRLKLRKETIVSLQENKMDIIKGGSLHCTLGDKDTKDGGDCPTITCTPITC